VSGSDQGQLLRQLEVVQEAQQEQQRHLTDLQRHLVVQQQQLVDQQHRLARLLGAAIRKNSPVPASDEGDTKPNMQSVVVVPPGSSLGAQEL